MPVRLANIEAALVARGTAAAEASDVIDSILRRRLAAVPAEVLPPFRLWRVLTGLALAVAAFVGIYLVLTHLPDGRLFAPGVWRGSVHGGIVGGLGGLAVAGLNSVRVELMRLLAG